MQYTQTNQFPNITFWVFALIVLFALLILLFSSEQSVSKQNLDIAKPAAQQQSAVKPPYWPNKEAARHEQAMPAPMYVRVPNQLETYKPNAK